MYSYIRGKLVDRTDEAVVVDANGVGYYINIGPDLSRKLGNIGDEITCYVYLNISRDNQELFGFPGKEYKRLFTQLIKISGVGPKAGLRLLEEFEPSELALLIVKEDSKTITKRMKGKGVGKKTAERIILELKDKFKDLNLEEVEEVHPDVSVQEDPQDKDAKEDILTGLLFLGYRESEAKDLIKRSYNSDLDLESNLKNAIKIAQ